MRDLERLDAQLELVRSEAAFSRTLKEVHASLQPRSLAAKLLAGAKIETATFAKRAARALLDRPQLSLAASVAIALAAILISRRPPEVDT
jgi:hypothetical protein